MSDLPNPNCCKTIRVVLVLRNKIRDLGDSGQPSTNLEIISPIHFHTSDPVCLVGLRYGWLPFLNVWSSKVEKALKILIAWLRIYYYSSSFIQISGDNSNQLEAPRCREAYNPCFPCVNSSKISCPQSIPDTRDDTSCLAARPWECSPNCAWISQSRKNYSIIAEYCTQQQHIATRCINYYELGDTGSLLTDAKMFPDPAQPPNSLVTQTWPSDPLRFHWRPASSDRWTRRSILNSSKDRALNYHVCSTAAVSGLCTLQYTYLYIMLSRNDETVHSQAVCVWRMYK